MTNKRIKCITLDADVVEAIEKTRGLCPFSAMVNEALKRELAEMTPEELERAANYHRALSEQVAESHRKAMVAMGYDHERL